MNGSSSYLFFFALFFCKEYEFCNNMIFCILLLLRLLCTTVTNQSKYLFLVNASAMFMPCVHNFSFVIDTSIQQKVQSVPMILCIFNPSILIHFALDFFLGLDASCPTWSLITKTNCLLMLIRFISFNQHGNRCDVTLSWEVAL